MHFILPNGNPMKTHDVKFMKGWSSVFWCVHSVRVWNVLLCSVVFSCVLVCSERSECLVLSAQCSECSVQSVQCSVFRVFSAQCSECSVLSVQCSECSECSVLSGHYALPTGLRPIWGPRPTV